MSNSIHVLMIEDNPVDAAALREELQEASTPAFDVEHTGTLADGLARLNSNGVDVVLLDLGLPDSKGGETLDRVARQAPDLPVVILTVSDDDALAVRAINQGAQDYLVKGTVGKRLLTQAIRYAMHRKHLELALREAQDVSENLRQEIADRKRAQEALRQSEAKYRIVSDHTYDWELWVAPDERFLYCSPSCELITGHTTEEFLADPSLLARLVHPDDRQQYEAHLNNAERAQAFGEGEWRFVRPDGTYRWVAHVCQPVFDEAGRFLGVRGSNRDITRRKAAEEELKKSHDELEARVKERTSELAATVGTLKESEEKLRALAENARAIFAIIQGSHFIYANSYLAEITGYSVAELLEMDFIKLVHPTFRPMVMERYRRRMMGEAPPSHYEFLLVTRTGEERWMDFSVTRIMLRGQPAAIGTAFDITERKRAEDGLRHTAAELASSNQDLEQFANVASHDLQEPLRMVSSFLKLLTEEYRAQLDDKAREYIDFAVDGADRMSVLIRDLLAFSRIGRRGEEFAETDMKVVLASAIASLRAGIEEAQATIAHDPLPTVKAVRSLMSQLLQNLIGNAIKYHAKDVQPQVHVGARREDRGWLFWVRDNGIGIKAEDRDRVFMIFQRLHTRQRYAGTGVGLAICKRIVEHHCGRIWVESEPGKGSTFYFTIPDRD